MSTEHIATSRYRGNRRPTNLVIDEELVELARAYFPSTKFKSLSGWAEATLRREFAKKAPRIRAAGMKVPESVFTK